MFVLLCGKTWCFLTKVCVLGVCIYIWIYINIYQRWWWYLWALSFLKCCLLVIVERGIIHLMVRSLNKIARLCGCLAFQGHNIYDVWRSQPPDWCTWVRWLFFIILFFLMRKKMCGFILCFGTKLCSWSCFVVSKKKQQIHHNLTFFFFFQRL